MSDNFVTNAGAGGSTFASDELSGPVHYPRVKRSLGRDGQAADVCTPFRQLSAASTNATSLKASAGTIWWLHVTNTNASPRYLKLYNKASAPTVGTDTPQHTFVIPGNAAGAGFCLPIEGGIDFATGIAYAITTGIGDADTGAVAANDVVINGG